VIDFPASPTTGEIFQPVPGGPSWKFDSVKWLPNSATGLAVAGASGDLQTNNGSGNLGALSPASGVASWLATPSSANLRAALTDEVGTGPAYFQGGALGTPASATLTNATGLPLPGGVAGTLDTAHGGTGLTAFAAGTDYATVAQAKSEVLIVAVSDETTAITTGAAKFTFRMPWAMTLSSVRASLSTASTSGNPAIDVNEGGVSIFSTTLTIDANEKTSVTAAVAAVISDATLADDAEITIDVDTAGTGARGLKVSLIGTRA